MRLNLNDDALRVYAYRAKGGSLLCWPDFPRSNPRRSHVEWVGLVSKQTGIRTTRSVV